MHSAMRTDFETEAMRRISAAAVARGWRVDVEPSTRFCCRVVTGSGVGFVIGTDLGLNDSASRRVAQDKAFAAHFLSVDGVPVVETRVLHSAVDTEALAGWGWPVVVKPCRGHGGLGVGLVRGVEEMEEAYAAASVLDSVVVVQRYRSAAEVRVVVLDGEVLASFGKERAQGRIGANLSQGASWTDVSERLHAEVVSLAVRATASLGLRVSGVDMLLERWDRAEGAEVLEVNATPGLRALAMHRPEKLDRLIGRALDRLC